MPTVIKPDVRKAMKLHDGYTRAKQRAAYNRLSKRALTDEELLERLALVPREDTRDLTGRLMGDPIPGDRRREQCKSMENVSFAEDTSW